MKKKLDTSGVLNELRGNSVFFPKKPQAAIQERVQAPPTPLAQVAQQPRALEAVKEVTIQREQVIRDTVIPRHHDTMQPSNRDTTTPQPEAVIFEVVRKAVKQIGKEAATHRFTLDEKNLLADIEYTYKRQGIRTSENEITRIAINYFIEDYRQNGEQSLLAKLLKHLNS
jgi:hypothetical protein